MPDEAPIVVRALTEVEWVIFEAMAALYSLPYFAEFIISCRPIALVQII